MRVLHLITRLIIGGAQENTLASVLGLRTRHGLDARLLSGPTSGPEGSLEPAAQAVPNLLTVLPSLVRPIHPVLDPIALLALARHFRSTQPHIVHTHSGKAGFLGRLASRLARVPVVVHTLHGPSFGPFQGRIPNLLLRAAERLAGRLTTHFVTVADAMTRQYLAAGIGIPSQYTRIVSGFDLQPFLSAQPDPALRARLGLDPDHFVVGKIARLFALKGHDDLIAAAPDLIREIPRLRFLLVGDGSHRARLQTAIDRLGLAPYFIFTGLVPPSQIPALLGVMDILVHLSLREGLARALPQALAAGRPVVAYDCDGAPEVCLPNQTGHLVPPGRLDLLRAAIRRLASDPDHRATLGRQGRDLVRDVFPVERMIDDLHALYLRLLPGQP
ncbi:MAG: glycosyltransferase family 4 protein [Verrucomicrobiae bacterium]|nr:glycosyltransferase family 4 protein [Verrucomicrobiae bacterium]